jgi:alpha-D-ribose 1-methylphosphonate 5-triphosphate synthase subunit PhnL
MNAPAPVALSAKNIHKSFGEHHVLKGISLDAHQGDVISILGASGSGKSTFLRCLYGNYLASTGMIAIRDEAHEAKHVRITNAEPRDVLYLRRSVVGYVSQFLRVIPRVSALDLVAEPLVSRGVDENEAHERAAALLARLNVPERLWPLAPATFSGGEQQRVNIARGLIAEHPVLLLDEPTASLDAENRDIVADLIVEARERGAAIVGIFHDEDTRAKVATRRLELRPPLRHTPALH